MQILMEETLMRGLGLVSDKPSFYGFGDINVGKLKTSSPFSCAALSMTLHKVKINPPNPKSG